MTTDRRPLGLLVAFTKRGRGGRRTVVSRGLIAVRRGYEAPAVEGRVFFRAPIGEDHLAGDTLGGGERPIAATLGAEEGPRATERGAGSGPTVRPSAICPTGGRIFGFVVPRRDGQDAIALIGLG